MNVMLCERLDEYLLGELAVDEAAAFATHLAGCLQCREEAALQRRMDELLTEAPTQLAPMPRSLEHRIACARRRTRQNHWFRRAGALAVAAGIVLALGLWALQRGASVPNDERPIAQAPTVRESLPSPPAPPLPKAGPEEPRTAPSASVALADPSSAIVVPVESRNPNIALFLVYPTVKSDRDEP